MFIDQAKIYVRAGKGGKECRSFYHNKYSRKGIPNGGDGGRGADIIVRADRNLSTLLDFKYNRHFFGQDGGKGLSNNKKGRDASSLIIRVPAGTMIKDIKTDCLLRDLNKDHEEVIVALGGKGGRGNQNYAQACEGEKGEEKELLLDLRLIADVGIVGFPNVGKSTLISRISNAHPKIANFPFTTKIPALGVVKLNEKSFLTGFIIAEIPGLIKGSSSGKGLGDRFLRHSERTKLLIHLIDMSGYEGRDPIEDYRAINEELKNYSKGVDKKAQIIAANKMDLGPAIKNLARFRKAIKKRVFPISALKNEGLEELIEAVSKRLSADCDKDR